MPSESKCRPELLVMPSESKCRPELLVMPSKSKCRLELLVMLSESKCCPELLVMPSESKCCPELLVMPSEAFDLSVARRRGCLPDIIQFSRNYPEWSLIFLAGRNSPGVKQKIRFIIIDTKQQKGSIFFCNLC